MNKHYYVDTCIWLNLFKKEGNSTKGIPYWQLAKDFIEKVNAERDIVFVSTIILKELTFTLSDKFAEVKKFFHDNNFVQIVRTTPEDYDGARRWEQDHQLLSFYDYLHTAIAQRLSALLITRDKDLMAFAQQHVDVFRPEDLLR